MSYHAAAIALCSITLAASSLRRLSLFSPPVITSSVWLTVFVTGLFYRDQFHAITDQAFTVWVIWFSISAIIPFFFTPAGVNETARIPLRTLGFDYSALLAALIAWLVWRTWELGTGGSEPFFLNLRLSAIGREGFEPIGLVERCYPLVFALFIFETIHAHGANRRLRLLCWTWMLAYAIATMGKFAVLTPILTWAVIQGILGRLQPGKYAPIGAGAVALMLVVHFVRGNYALSLAEVIGTYIYSPIVALGYLEPAQSALPGPYVFRFFYAVAHALGLSAAPVDLILDYIDVPVPTNAYTVMQPFMHDFSLAGVAAGASVYAAIFTPGFLLARYSSGYWAGVYAALSVSLVGQFMGDLLIGSLSGNIQIIIAMTFIFVLSRRVINVR